jgi:hypothetical protein
MNGIADTSPHRLKGHYLVCNWNDKIVPLLKELNPKGVGVEARPVVIVTERSIDQSVIPNDQATAEYFEDVMFYPGNPTKAQTLRRVNFQDAHCVIVLANAELGENSDANTLLSLFSMVGAVSPEWDEERRDGDVEIREVLKQRKIEGNPLHIVVEITDVTNYAKFRIFEDDQDVSVEILRPESIRTRILAQAARTAGLGGFFVDLMTYGENTNEIYSALIPRTWFQSTNGNEKGTFSELCLWFNRLRSEKGISAIPVGIWRPPHCFKDERDGTFVNPGDDFLIRERDKVLVICQSREIANQIERL